MVEIPLEQIKKIMYNQLIIIELYVIAEMIRRNCMNTFDRNSDSFIVHRRKEMSLKWFGNMGIPSRHVQSYVG